LLKKYNIEKNDVLSKFVVSETLFQTIEEALRFAHALDVEAEERERADRARREEMEAAIEMERLRVESSTRLRDPPPHTWPAAQSASTGAKFIFVAVSLAVIALLSQGSFIVFIAGEGGVALLVMVLVFAGWAYTIVSIVRKRPLNRPLVVTCAVASFLLGALFAFVSGDSKFGDAHDFGAALLFAFASCLLAVGALKYRVASPEPLQIGRKA
jgi:hypothetical protein